MHFIASLFFLLLGILLTFAYLAFGYFLWLGVRWFLQRLKVEANRTRFSEINIKVRANKKVLLFFGALSASTCLYVFIDQWAEWKTEENAHIEAKNYFVAGQVVNGIRIILTDVLHPDNPILYPANMLQEWIYHSGVKLLPEDDGERSIWMDGWFIYPYTKKMRLPYFVRRFEESPRMIPFLDRIWWTLEMVSEHPIADPKMKAQHYFRNFPRMILYYCIHEGYYMGNNWGSFKEMNRSKRHRERSEKIIGWIADYENRIENTSTPKFFQKNPKIKAILETCRIMELHDLFFADLLSGKFTCDNDYVERIVKATNAFGIESKTQKPTYAKMQDKRQLETLYNIAIYGIRSRFVMFALNEYCGKEFFMTKEQILVDKDNLDIWRKFEILFEQELVIFKEIKNAK